MLTRMKVLHHIHLITVNDSARQSGHCPQDLPGLPSSSIR
jgi:hypothetical protein